MKSIFFLCGLFFIVNVQASELYRSVDKEGKVLYSDSPFSDTDAVEALNLGNAPASDESLSYEARKAKETFPVTLYTFPECGSACQQGRDLLNQRGIPFTEKSLTSQEDLDNYRKKIEGGTVPTITVGKTWLIGLQADQWHKEFDFAGYPKTAPYRPKPATPRPVAEPTIPAPQ